MKNRNGVITSLLTESKYYIDSGPVFIKFSKKKSMNFCELSTASYALYLVAPNKRIFYLFLSYFFIQVPGPHNKVRVKKM